MAGHSDKDHEEWMRETRAWEAYCIELDLKPPPEPCERFRGLYSNEGGLCANCKAPWPEHPGGRLMNLMGGKEFRDQYLRDADDQRERDE